MCLVGFLLGCPTRFQSQSEFDGTREPRCGFGSRFCVPFRGARARAPCGDWDGQTGVWGGSQSVVLGRKKDTGDLEVPVSCLKSAVGMRCASTPEPLPQTKSTYQGQPVCRHGVGIESARLKPSASVWARCGRCVSKPCSLRRWWWRRPTCLGA